MVNGRWLGGKGPQAEGALLRGGCAGAFLLIDDSSGGGGSGPLWVSVFRYISTDGEGATNLLAGGLPQVCTLCPGTVGLTIVASWDRPLGSMEASWPPQACQTEGGSGLEVVLIGTSQCLLTSPKTTSHLRHCPAPPLALRPPRHLPVKTGRVDRACLCRWSPQFLSRCQWHSGQSACSRGGGGRPGPVLVCDTPQSPPPPQVLRDSGVGAMAPTAPKFFCACFPFIKPSMF